VEVSARELDAALGGGDNSAVGAHHASGKVLSNSAATVAKTELLAAHADHSSIVGARSAVAVAGSGVAGDLGSSGGSSWCWLSSGNGGLGRRDRRLSSSGR
jgi:hypothetical protein